jgi:hypothetical protein
MSYRYRNPHYKKYHPETLYHEGSDAEADGAPAQYDISVGSVKKGGRRSARVDPGANGNVADGILADMADIAARQTLGDLHPDDGAADLAEDDGGADDDDDGVVVEGNDDEDDTGSQDSPDAGRTQPRRRRKRSGRPESGGSATFCAPCGRVIEPAKWSAHQRAHTLSTNVLSRFYEGGGASGGEVAEIPDSVDGEEHDEAAAEPAEAGGTRRAARRARTRIRGSWRETAGWAAGAGASAQAAEGERAAGSNGGRRSAGRGRGSFVMVDGPAAGGGDREPSGEARPRAASWERLLEGIRAAPELSKAQKRELVYKVFEGRASHPSSSRQQQQRVSSGGWGGEGEAERDSVGPERGLKRNASGMLDDDDDGDSLDSLRDGMHFME